MDRRLITFEQAEGAQALPTQLAVGEISQELRSRLWAIIYGLLLENCQYDRTGYGSNHIIGKIFKILQDYWILHLFRFADEFTSDLSFWVDRLGKTFKSGGYIDIFGFIQFVLRHREKPYGFSEMVSSALERSRSAYFIAEQTILPATMPEERQTISEAFIETHKHGFLGAKTHLRQAGEFLSAGKWADSTRESIHAVESVVTKISGEGGTLSAALNDLQKKGRLNPNLKRAMNALYDYTSDAKGIRHALVFAKADVSEHDALYMFSTCAAFLTYSIRTLHEAD